MTAIAIIVVLAQAVTTPAPSFARCSVLFRPSLGVATTTPADPNRQLRREAPRSRRADQKPPLRVDVDRVLVPVTVLDWNDRPFPGLTKNSFHIYENGVSQDVLDLISEDAPIALGIVFDKSHSMKQDFEQVREAVRSFVQAGAPEDELFLLAFNDDAAMVCPPNCAVREVGRAVTTLTAEGVTALFDAIYLALNELRHARLPRRVLLVVSDGGENSSRFNERELMLTVRESDARIFAVSPRSRSRVLEKIAGQSGGRAVHFRNKDELYRFSNLLSVEMHSQYVLTYSPRDRTADGKFRKIKVVLVASPTTSQLRVYWRRGYYAPSR